MTHVGMAKDCPFCSYPNGCWDHKTREWIPENHCTCRESMHTLYGQSEPIRPGTKCNICGERPAKKRYATNEQWQWSNHGEVTRPWCYECIEEHLERQINGFKKGLQQIRELMENDIQDHSIL